MHKIKVLACITLFLLSVVVRQPCACAAQIVKSQATVLRATACEHSCSCCRDQARHSDSYTAAASKCCVGDIGAPVSSAIAKHCHCVDNDEAAANLSTSGTFVESEEERFTDGSISCFALRSYELYLNRLPTDLPSRPPELPLYLMFRSLLI